MVKAVHLDLHIGPVRKIKVMLKPYDITTEIGKFPIGMEAIMGLQP
jgi:hypothetical protein